MLNRAMRPGDIHSGKWNGLGGKLEPGESPEEGVQREVLEESGLRIERPQLVGLLTFPRFKDDEDWYVYVFVANDFSGSLCAGAEGELHWVEDSQLCALPVWEGDKLFLPWVLSEKFFTAKLVYESGRLSYAEHSLYERTPGVPGERIQCQS